MRTLPEITRTYTRDVERHSTLLRMARSGEAGDDEIRELSILDGEMHAFSRMCRRWAPLAPTEMGFRWGEVLRHEVDDGITAIVREGGLVEYEGEDMDIGEATRRVAATGRRVSIGGWTGSAGAVGDLAGLRPGASAPDAKAPGEEDREIANTVVRGAPTEDAAETPPRTAVTEDRDVAVATASPATPADKKAHRPARRKSVPDENYDLFG